MLDKDDILNRENGEISNEDLAMEIRAAISQIARTGQSYKIGTRSVTRADLSQLREFLRELESNKESPQGLFGNVFVSSHDRR